MDLELTLDEILNSTQGRLLNTAQKPAEKYSELITDSRKCSPRSIFLCIPGNKVDGHDFIPQALAQGSTLILGPNLEKLKKALAGNDLSFIHVPDALTALQKLATFYRTKFKIPTIALTGSSGKTTTKDLMASIFNQVGPAVITEGTLNNHWGVPMTAMRLKKNHLAAVFELGISGFGEMLPLVSICQPEIGLITTIGASHLEVLKNEEGVLKEKRVLFDWIVENAKTPSLIFNLDSPWLKHLYEDLAFKNVQKFSFSLKNTRADVFLTKKKSLDFKHNFGWDFEVKTPWGKLTTQMPLPGLHNLSNALAAISATLQTGIVKINAVEKGLAQPQRSQMRSDLTQLRSGAILYDDSYNANPTSVAALIETASEIKPHFKKIIAVVGDMLELGEQSAEYHKNAGAHAAEQGIHQLLAVGDFAQNWTEGFSLKASSSQKAWAFKSQDQLYIQLQNELQKNTTETLIIVKGSRGAKMDQIVALLKS